MEEHTIILTDDNDIYTFGFNHYQQCSVEIKGLHMFEPYLLKKSEIGINKGLIIQLIAGSYSTLRFITNCECECFVYNILNCLQNHSVYGNNYPLTIRIWKPDGCFTFCHLFPLFPIRNVKHRTWDFRSCFVQC